MNHQGRTSGQVGQRWTRGKIADGESVHQVQRYIRLAEMIHDILRESKSNRQDKISFRTMELNKYFSKGYDASRIQTHINKLLEADYRKRQRAQER